LYWLTKSLKNGEKMGLLCVAAHRERSLDKLSESLEAAATETMSYLERYSLASILTRACGTAGTKQSSNGYRQKMFDSARGKIADMANDTHIKHTLEWKPLLEDLCTCLNKIGSPDSLTDTDRATFDEYVIPALGRPYYAPLAELYASRWLRNMSIPPADRFREGQQLAERERLVFDTIGDYDEDLRDIEDELIWFEEQQKNNES
jgi:hypothetical protein